MAAYTCKGVLTGARHRPRAAPVVSTESVEREVSGIRIVP